MTPIMPSVGEWCCEVVGNGEVQYLAVSCELQPVCVCVQDMELINILYLQDIDLGIGREAFDDLYADSSVTAVKGNECAQLKQV